MSQAEDKRKDEEVANYALEQFLNLSRVLTGFERVDLLGTGMAEAYYQAITGVYQEAVPRLLLEAQAIFTVYGEKHPDFKKQIRTRIIEDIVFSQLAKNIIQLWYIGSYLNYNDPAPLAFKPATFVSPEAYENGLIWQVAGSHPPGAKHPGFGSWHLKPRPELKD
jgi:hypothetical protein